MPTPHNPERIVGILIGRHRRLANLAYKELLDNLSEGKPNGNLQSFYRGLACDLIAMLKELREQEAHNKNWKYCEILDEIESLNGSNFKQKVEAWICDVKTRPTQDVSTEN